MMEASDRSDFRSWMNDAQRHNMVGVYLDPPALIGGAEETERIRAPERFGATEVLGHTVVLTRMSGLFVERPANLVSIDEAFSALVPGGASWTDADFDTHLMTEEKREFAESVSRAFNAVACELMFATGRPRSAIAPASMLPGSSDADRIVVDTSVGNHETFEASRRVSDQWLFAKADEWTEGWHRISDLNGASALELRRTNRLLAISHELPELVLSAYRAFELEQTNASVIASWTACEIIVGDWWRIVHQNREESEWNQILGNDRVPIVRRIEYLSLAGVIEPALRDSLHRARQERNRIAHRAEGSHAAARECIEALREVLTASIGEPPPLATRSSMAHW